MEAGLSRLVRERFCYLFRVSMAMRESTPLMTLDHDLRKASRASGVQFVEPQP
jgi:hypothetical protein